jgi:hypothetical protein
VVKFCVMSLVVFSPISLAQEFDMPTVEWLARLKPIVSQGLCNGEGSPFKQVYKGASGNCVPELEKLFDLCAKDEPSVILPSTIKSVPQANWYGRVLAECVSAHYQGGVVLDAFREVQRVAKAPPGVG